MALYRFRSPNRPLIKVESCQLQGLARQPQLDFERAGLQYVLICWSSFAFPTLGFGRPAMLWLRRCVRFTFEVM